VKEQDIIKLFERIILPFSILRLIPHLIIFNVHKNKSIIKYDIERWLSIRKLTNRYSTQIGFLYLMTFLPEFRNLYYYRIGFIKHILKYLCRPINTLFITARNGIGPGLFIQHGFATIIAADSIGKDCWVNQQVTIGFSSDIDCPILEDNVTIRAGAKVIGAITIGKNSEVGANAVVVKNVPENCTVVGVPAYIVRRNGIKTRENL